jgi:L-proline amide hydrolase
VVQISAQPVSKGYAPFAEYRTWYRVTGTLTPGHPAVVVLHGGPGSTHDYLLNLASLAGDGRAVVHYDQIGNGGSSHLPDRGTDFWTVQLFLDELGNLLEYLGIADSYVLFGHSWGGMLAVAHAAAKPQGMRGLIIANSPASYPLFLRELEVLRADLPPGVNEELRRHEKAGTTYTDDYFAAARVFYQRHICRMNPWPRDYMASFYEMYNDSTVYFTMNGPSEFHVTGTLRDWSVVDICSEISVPTLLVAGRFDEVTEAAIQPFIEQIPDVRCVTFEQSSHGPHLEEPERFLEVIRDYLKELD